MSSVSSFFEHVEQTPHQRFAIQLNMYRFERCLVEPGAHMIHPAAEESYILEPDTFSKYGDQRWFS